jgi:glycosyltransferase involved in cell wall biosynthesis
MQATSSMNYPTSPGRNNKYQFTGETPLVSVVMPAHNAGRLLDKAIRSITRQTYANWELIIVDDGSTDETPQRIAQWKHRDPRIRSIHLNSNCGTSAALNRGVREANGEFIARMDADDVCFRSRFEKQVAYLKEHSETACLGTRRLLIDGWGMPIWVKEDSPTRHEEIDNMCLNGTAPVTHPSVMFRRSIFEDSGGYDESLVASQDHDLWLRMAERGRIEALPDILMAYRIHNASTTSKKRREQHEAARVACERAYYRRGLRKEPVIGDQFRPDGTKASRLRCHLDYGRRALTYGYTLSAFKYISLVLADQPTNRDGWRQFIKVMLTTLGSRRWNKKRDKGRIYYEELKAV